MTRAQSVRLTLFGSRVLVAMIFLWHGVPKAIDWPGATAKFVGVGLPGILGPVTGVVEVVAGGLLVLGYSHRAALTALIVLIAGAIGTVRIPAGITAALERDLLILAASALLWHYGPGAFELRFPPRARPKVIGSAPYPNQPED